MTVTDRTETLHLLAAAMAEGQIRQARVLLHHPHAFYPGTGWGNKPTTQLVAALMHMRSAVGWLQAAAR